MQLKSQLSVRRLFLSSAVAVTSVAVAAHLIFADAPATRPSFSAGAEGSPAVPEGTPPLRNKQPGWRLGPERRNGTITPEEVHAATDFFEANSPNRMAFFNRLPADSSLRGIISNDLVWRYRPIKNYKETSPELYDILVHTVKLRDEAFKLAKDGDTGALHAKAAEVVDQSLQARKMRLDILSQELSRQQEQYASDAADPSHLVDVESSRLKDDEERITRRVEQFKSAHGQSRVDDVASDPLADAMPSQASR